jgi:hypothetical protein
MHLAEADLRAGHPRRAARPAAHDRGVPSAAEYRHRAARRDRWHTAAAMALVAALASLVFWLLPLPPASKTSADPPTPSAIAARARADKPLAQLR